MGTEESFMGRKEMKGKEMGGEEAVKRTEKKREKGGRGQVREKEGLEGGKMGEIIDIIFTRTSRKRATKLCGCVRRAICRPSSFLTLAVSSSRLPGN